MPANAAKRVNTRPKAAPQMASDVTGAAAGWGAPRYSVTVTDCGVVVTVARAKPAAAAPCSMRAVRAEIAEACALGQGEADTTRLWQRQLLRRWRGGVELVNSAAVMLGGRVVCWWCRHEVRSRLRCSQRGGIEGEAQLGARLHRGAHARHAWPPDARAARRHFQRLGARVGLLGAGPDGDGQQRHQGQQARHCDRAAGS